MLSIRKAEADHEMQESRGWPWIRSIGRLFHDKRTCPIISLEIVKAEA